MKTRWLAHATARRLTARHEAFHYTSGADEIQLEQSLLELVIGALCVIHSLSQYTDRNEKVNPDLLNTGRSHFRRCQWNLPTGLAGSSTVSGREKHVRIQEEPIHLKP